MKRVKVAVLFIALGLWLVGCAGESTQNTNSQQENNKPKFSQIAVESAKARLDKGEKIVLVDVRTREEFEEEHIKGALLLPLDKIRHQASSVMPDKEAVYFIYCRSGNRSKSASAQLIEMGYHNIYDLGGIINWPYEKEKGK